MRRSRRIERALIAVSLAGVACHRTQPALDASVLQQCHAARGHQADTRIHIDGLGMNTPEPGDSLIMIVNDREVWRGVYDPCHPSGSAAAVDHVIPATDSVISLLYLHGPDVAAKYHIGGKGPDAYVIRTAPPPE